MVKRIRSSVVAMLAAGVVAAGGLSPSRLAAQDIVPAGPPIGNFAPLGPGWYLDVGQTFVAGGAYMNSFSFWFGPEASKNFAGEGDPQSGVMLVPYVMAWDGTSAFGSVLFVGTATLVDGLTSYERYDFATGDLAVSAGTMYVAFVQAVDDGTHTGNIKVGTSYTGAGAVATNVQGQAVKPVTDDWDISNAGLSTTFAATFSNVPVTATPEPATLALLATGMAGVFGTGRLRRKRR